MNLVSICSPLITGTIAWLGAPKGKETKGFSESLYHYTLLNNGSPDVWVVSPGSNPTNSNHIRRAVNPWDWQDKQAMVVE